MQHSETGGSEMPESVKTVIVYDAASGDIRHVHQVITMPGAVAPEQSVAERDAMLLAKEEGYESSGLSCLTVDAEKLNVQARYRVDVKRGVLVEIPEAKGK